MPGPIRPLVLLLLLWARVLSAQTPAAEPAQAAVRIQSHGASAMVIATAPGKSWLLSCGHMFLDEQGRPSPALRAKRLVLDGPPQPQARFAGTRPARLLACDHDLDLSLIELDNGPFAYVPVAPPGHRPGKRLLSIGYDEMRWPVTQKSATFLGTKGNTTYTRERPWHGRSGGGLIDREAHVLVGVVQGYELNGARRGLYVSQEAILSFLAKHMPVTGGLTPRRSLPITGGLTPRRSLCPSG
jgi:hypothetical protein